MFDTEHVILSWLPVFVKPLTRFFICFLLSYYLVASLSSVIILVPMGSID